MALIINDKLLFVHVRKSGGSFLRSVLAENEIPTKNFGTPDEWNHYQHYTINQIHKEFPETTNLESFGYVRDPIQWIRSYWAWARKSDYLSKKDRIEAARNHWLYDCMSTNFVDFLESYLKNHKGKATEFLLNPLGYEYDLKTGTLNGSQLVKNVFKYEYLLQEMVGLLRRNGIFIREDSLFSLPRRREAAASTFRDQTNVPLDIAKELMESEKEVYRLYYNIV